MRDEKADLAALALRTQDVYERNALRFDRERPKGLHERPWLDRFLQGIAAGGHILDLGCGAGDPIAAYMRRCGYAVVGLDASHAMLAMAQARYPEGEWLHGDMRVLKLGRRFDDIIGWNSFFHLTQEEQRGTLARIADHLRPGGTLMLTVGPAAGEVGGKVGDDAVYHASLSPDEYAACLNADGIDILDFVKEDPGCDFQTVLLARKRAD